MFVVLIILLNVIFKMLGNFWLLNIGFEVNVG